MRFICNLCGQERDEDEDGGVVVKATEPDGTVTVGLAVCGATDECWAECERLYGEFLASEEFGVDQIVLTLDPEEVV